MSAKSKIEWTEATWNPMLGCSKISPGCRGCYAINHVHRMTGNPNAKIAAANAGLTVIQGGHPNWTGKVRLIESRLEIPLRNRKPTMYFVNSLSDMFHEDVADHEIGRVFGTMQFCRWHTFQVLTKRAERMERWHESNPPHTSERFEFLSNVWLGVSVESRAYLSRIDNLRRTPAAVRFLSIEPLLEDLGQIDFTGIHWVIVGGESGPNARPMHPDWARNIREQCIAARVPFFFKQWGAWAWHQGGYAGNRAMSDAATFVNGERFNAWMVPVGKKAAGRELDGRTWDEMPEVKRA